MKPLMTGLITVWLGGTAIACSASPPNPQVTLPERVPSSEPVESAVGKVPEELIQKMRVDLAQRVGGAASSAAVVRAEAVTWPDGALGCRKRGEFYTQQLVRGYRVEFAVGEHRYPYHADAKSGFFKLCRSVQRSVEGRLSSPE